MSWTDDVRSAATVRPARALLLSLLCAAVVVSCVRFPPGETLPIIRDGDTFLTPFASATRTSLLDAEAGATGAPQEGAASRQVVEPDVYGFSDDGSVLYAANAYRGLVAFDVRSRETPTLLGRAGVNGTPKEMYLRPGTVVLLMDPSYGAYVWYGAVSSVSTQSKSSVAFIATADAGLSVRSTVELSGPILDSRVVGDVLLVATNDGWDSSSSSGTDVTAVSADSAAAGVRASLHAISLVSERVLSTFAFPGYCTAIHISDSAVFAASQDSTWVAQTSTIVRYDIAANDALTETSRVTVGGVIQDRFKMDLWAGFLRVVALDSSTGWADRTTKAFTIDYGADPANPVSHEVTALSLAPGESLFATRFSGDTCYVVTYRTRDPLFVVSFADPVNPRELSALHDIPGYSTHIEIVPDSLGRDRLFAVGVDDTAGFRVKVVMFDASDPGSIMQIGQPLLLGDSFSSSSATWDWKRINRLPDLSAFALPYCTWDASTGAVSWEVALVSCLDSGPALMCVLPDSGDCLRTVPAAADLVYTYADDRLGAWRVAPGADPVRTAEVIVAENVLWASAVEDNGVKAVWTDSGLVVKTFAPDSYDLTDFLFQVDLPSTGEDGSYLWYSPAASTVARTSAGLFFLANGYSATRASQTAVILPVSMSGGLARGTSTSLAATLGWTPYAAAWGSRFVPAGAERLAVFHGGLTLFDSDTGAMLATLPCDNGVAGFVDGVTAYCFASVPAPGREDFCTVTLTAWDISDPSSPVVSYTSSFPGFPVSSAGNGRFIAAYEPSADQAASTVLLSVAVAGGTSSILDQETVTGAIRAAWADADLFAFLMGDRWYPMLYAAASPRGPGDSFLKTASIGADGSLLVSDVCTLAQTGWTAAIVRDGPDLAAQSGTSVAVCSAASGSLTVTSSWTLATTGWTEPVFSIAEHVLYWAAGMNGIGRMSLP